MSAKKPWDVAFSKQAVKDAKKIGAAGLRTRAEARIEVLRADPFRVPPPYERLVGDLAGFYSRRINIQHRLVYEVLVREHAVKVLRMWTRYE